MAPGRPLLETLKRSGKISIYFVAGLLLLVWLLETPANILGKADAVGYAVCHRIDIRSFHLGVRQLPLCARCTGQYVGVVLGLLFQAIFARRRSGFPSRQMLTIMVFFGLAYVIDGLNSFLYLQPMQDFFSNLPHLYEPTNALRLMTGTGMGLILAWLIYPAFFGSIYAQPDTRPAISSWKSLLGFITLVLLADFLILKGSTSVLYSAAILSAAGVVVLLSMAYSIVIIRLIGKENTYRALTQVSLPLLAGFTVALAQIATLDLVRMLLTGTWGGFTFG